MVSERIPVPRLSFGSKKINLIEQEPFQVSACISDEGLVILLIKSDRVALEVLPFQGQQIWKAAIDGRALTMRSLVTTPVFTSDYLRNYGAYLVHCGATAIGGPSHLDDHQIHGELPNANYNRAWIQSGNDSNGNSFIEIQGEYFHEVAMTGSYCAHPVIRLTQSSSVVDVSMEITNTAGRTMGLMYMAHINFLPVDDSEICATHNWDPESFRVITELPTHVREKSTPEFIDFLVRAGRDPTITSKIPIGTLFDPELVGEIDYIGDENGIGHTLIIHPDGTSDYLSQDVGSTPLGIRYLQRTPDHDCVGTGPSTSGVTGRTSEAKKGTIKSLEPGATFSAKLQFGTFDEQETKQMQARINRIIGAFS